MELATIELRNLETSHICESRIEGSHTPLVRPNYVVALGESERQPCQLRSKELDTSTTPHSVEPWSTTYSPWTVRQITRGYDEHDTQGKNGHHPHPGSHAQPTHQTLRVLRTSRRAFRNNLSPLFRLCNLSSMLGTGRGLPAFVGRAAQRVYNGRDKPRLVEGPLGHRGFPRLLWVVHLLSRRVGYPPWRLGRGSTNAKWQEVEI